MPTPQSRNTSIKCGGGGGGGSGGVASGRLGETSVECQWPPAWSDQTLACAVRSPRAGTSGHRPRVVSPGRGRAVGRPGAVPLCRAAIRSGRPPDGPLSRRLGEQVSKQEYRRRPTWRLPARRAPITIRTGGPERGRTGKGTGSLHPTCTHGGRTRALLLGAADNRIATK